ncbi:MAG: ATP-binding protein [Myxococcales bacterium]|nr:ATP-binding protein [Myxococcales bacterium]
MLIEFRVENHRSLKTEQVFTFEEARAGGEDDRPRKVAGHEHRILTVAAVYGANASGKSNLLDALTFMQDAVVRSHRMWEPESGVPRDPFAWNTEPTAPSSYIASFIADEIRFEYGFRANDERFLEEWLYAYPHGRKQVWFERDEQSFKFGDSLRGENRLVEQVTRPNALFLSVAAQHKIVQIEPVYHLFRSIGSFNIRRSSARWPYEPRLEYWLSRVLIVPNEPVQGSLFGDTPNWRAGELRRLLTSADVGIVDIKLIPDPSTEGDRSAGRARGRVMLQHKTSRPDSWLPLEQESQGTLSLLRMAPTLVEAMRHGGLVVVDELEASLHPLLALNLVKQFNSPSTNPNNAQLLFATHDTNLLGTVLGEPALRRDQVWLSEKDAEGATQVYPLSDFKPRKEENLERGYLQGRYGAIPFIGSGLSRGSEDPLA